MVEDKYVVAYTRRRRRLAMLTRRTRYVGLMLAVSSSLAIGTCSAQNGTSGGVANHSLRC